MPRLPDLRFYIFLCLYFLSSPELIAQLKLPAVFSDRMVLQRNQLIPVWGTANPGASVTVSFSSQQKNTVADEFGKWSVTLDPLRESATAAELTVASDVIITFRDVLVGDVWLCTGQSNMEYPLDRASKRYAKPAKGTDIAEAEMKNTNRADAIRYIYVERTLTKFPQLPSKGWIKGNDTTVDDISAIGYFFAKEVYEQTKVPIGIISSSWGGTRIEQWTAPAAYRESSVFQQFVTSDTFKIDGMKPGQMYRGMIEPLIPFAIKGILWYQGESNCMIEDHDTYVEKMRVFENSWRKSFKNASMPFYTVQIAPYLYTSRKDPKPHTAELLPLFWEAQTNCMKLPNTYMVATTDLVDNLKDIHPSYKWIIAHRMALQALKNEYNQTQLHSNHPQFKSIKRKKNKLILSFHNTGGGFKSGDGKELSWFTIADATASFEQAKAEISGKKIIVYSERIAKPKYVRFAWNEAAMPNLVTTEGLPCIPFRSGK